LRSQCKMLRIGSSLLRKRTYVLYYYAPIGRICKEAAAGAKTGRHEFSNSRKFYLPKAAACSIITYASPLPQWWNGRHDGLKIHCWQQHVGSSPTCGTIKKPHRKAIFPVRFFCFVTHFYFKNENKDARRGERRYHPPEASGQTQRRRLASA
jgi:hypothetical protein